MEKVSQEKENSDNQSVTFFSVKASVVQNAICPGFIRCRKYKLCPFLASVTFPITLKIKKKTKKGVSSDKLKVFGFHLHKIAVKIGNF